MKILAVVPAFVVLALVPAVQAQRPSMTNLPSSPILPMSNPIAPMSNPIMPVVNHGAPPAVSAPSAAPSRAGDRRDDGKGGDRRDDRRGNDRRDDGRVEDRRDSGGNDRRDDRRDDRRSNRDVPVVVLGGAYWDPAYYYPPPQYYYPQYPPEPTPGQLPGTYRSFEPPSTPASTPEQAADGPAPAPVVVAPEILYEPEPRMIILTPETPPLTVTPPALGTSRGEVLMTYGEPWGTIKSTSQETLYFQRGLVVVLVDGKVSQIK